MNRTVARFALANLLVLVACSDAAPPGGAGSSGGATASADGGTSPVNPAIIGAAEDAGVSQPASGASCMLDTRTFFIADGNVVESITAGGRLYNFESNGAGWQTNGVDLTDIPGYASGPCRGRARGQCEFDTRTFVPVGSSLVESVTAYGSYWSFDANGNATAQDLSLMQRYKTNGPCESKAPGSCKFDTRTFVTQGADILEAITAYGRMFTYALDGTPQAGNGADLTSIARYAAGPCSGKKPGECVFNTRVFEDVGGHVLETVTAYGKIYRWEANGAAADAQVQPSNVALDGIEPWASGVCKK